MSLFAKGNIKDLEIESNEALIF